MLWDVIHYDINPNRTLRNNRNNSSHSAHKDGNRLELVELINFINSVDNIDWIFIFQSNTRINHYYYIQNEFVHIQKALKYLLYIS